MKKCFSAIILIVLILGFFSNPVSSQDVTVKIGDSSSAYKGTLYNLELNGVWIPTETPCIVVSGVAYVPLREVFQDYLGLTVGYDEGKEMAFVQSGAKKMEFSFKQQAIYQNGTKVNSSLPVALVNGNTMVPLSLTASFFGYTVAVKSDNKTITIRWINKNETSAIVKETKVSGTISRIAYYPESGKEIILIETQSKVIQNQYVINPAGENPYYRLCIQLQNTSIEKVGTLDVYAGSVQQIRFAQADSANQIANVVVEIDHQPEYKINTVSNGIQIEIVSGKNGDNTQPVAQVPSPTKAPVPTQAPKPTALPTPTPKPTAAPTPQPSQAPTATPSPAPSATPSPGSGIQIGNGPISYSMQGNDCIIWMNGVNLMEQMEQNPNQYSIEYRDIEKVLQIRIPLTDAYITEVLPGNALLNGIISYRSNMREEVTIRISGKDRLNYTVAANGENGTKIILRANDAIAGTSPAAPSVTPKPTPTTAPQPTKTAAKPDTTPAPKPTDIPQIPVVTPNPTTVPQTTPVPSQAPAQSGFKDLPNRGEGDRSGTVSYVAGSDMLIIDTIGLEKYRIFRLSDPSRIVIDLYQNVIDSKQLDVPQGRMYTRIRTGQSETTTARIVLDLEQDHDWEAVKSGNRLTVTLKPSGTQNLSYLSADNGASLVLKSPGLRQRIEQNLDSIMIEDNKETKIFAFVFQNGVIDLGNGKFQVGDSLMRTVQTLTSGNSAFLVIERESTETAYRFRFTDSDDVVIIEPTVTTGTGGQQETGTGQQPGASSGTPVSGNSPSPTPMPTPAPAPVASGGKLVVLDAGHGGNDPGATYGKDEKWYNLDITLRIEAILKSKGVNVKLTRTTDVFVGLDERAEMANAWNADLFVSVHNNAFFDKGTNGTMTFYYTTSYKGKEYAKIIQNDLLKNLGSRDIGVKSANFVVIKKTKMPAVLVEIGCLSNEAERAKLDTEEYRQKAAESLAESIIKILAK